MPIQRLCPSQPLAATQAASHRRIMNTPSLSPTLAPRLVPALERVDQQQPLAPDATLRHDLETFMAKYGGRPAATSKLGIRVARAGNAVDNLLEGYPTLSSPTVKRASKFLAALSKGQSLAPFNAWSKYMRLRVNLKKSSLSALSLLIAAALPTLTETKGDECDALSLRTTGIPASVAYVKAGGGWVPLLIACVVVSLAVAFCLGCWVGMRVQSSFFSQPPAQLEAPGLERKTRTVGVQSMTTYTRWRLLPRFVVVPPVSDGLFLG